MQVSQVQDHVTHAVIGGGQTIEFGISSSAEFFNILSSTLYKDQILAVTREVLCNANDAHIEAGCTSIPVEITLNETTFIVKDFGKGIHRDDIGPIYGTYGNSTKKNDGKQTGGFGLGCKAPFAYTEHFEVISCHEGIKTIYNMSKSSGQAMGKPGIVPIHSFPTTDTGLQVTIKIKNRMDYMRYLKLVNRIVRNGDMNVKLNGEVLDRLGFDSSKTNYMVTAQSDILDNPSRIMVRYGNVIYPIDDANPIHDNHSKIIEHLNTLNGGQYSNRLTYSIVFQAQPHSIAVTPSRESLSMQDHTVNTLNQLFTGYLQLLDMKFQAVCDTYAEKSVIKAIEDKDISELLNKEERLPGSKDVERQSLLQMFDMSAIANRYMQMHYPEGLQFRKADIARRISALYKNGFIPRGHYHTFMKAMTYVHGKRDQYGRQTWNKCDWLQRRIIKPLISKAVAAGLYRDRLYVYDHSLIDAPTSWSSKPALVLATNAKPVHLFRTLPYFRNIVVVTASMKDVWDRAKRHAIFIERGQFDGFMVYHTSMKLVEKEAALKFFADRGMQVVDLTVRQEWEAVPVVTDKVAAPKKPAKKGVVCLSSVLLGSKVNLRHSLEDTAKRIDNPEFIVHVSHNNDVSYQKFPNWDESTSAIIVKLWGDKGAITNNTKSVDKWVKEGVKMFKEYIHSKVIDYIGASVTIKEYWAFKPERLHTSMPYYNRNLLDALYKNNAACLVFGIKNNLTDEDKLYLTLWAFLVDQNHRSNRPPEVQKLVDTLETIPLDPINEVVIAKFTNNPLIRIIDAESLSALLNREDPTSPTAVKAIEILVAVLNQ